jgi:predicted membrane-bound dolichyl-phosphate-mannose-protein mannosyltransferase
VLLGDAKEGAKAPSTSGIVKPLALLSILCVAILVATLSVYARYPGGTLFSLAQSSALAALVLGVAALVTGTIRLAHTRPDLRRPIVFLLVITSIIFLMHMYVVNSPPTSTAGTLSGPVGSSFQDSQLQVSSTLVGTLLHVNVTDISSGSGANAVAEIQVLIDNQSLPVSALLPLPSYSTPLEPADVAYLGYNSTTEGSWTVQVVDQPTLRVDYQYLTCFHVPEASDNRAVYGCIMDETYYVPSAMGILAGTQCAPYADNCNLEHPPLAKALIAGGMAVFGVDDFGWRVSNIVLGTLSVALVFVLAFSLTGNRRLSYFATLLFAADTMFFVHSSAALIDVPSVFFSLLGLILYFRRGELWKVNNYVASGICFGLAALSKETAIFAIGAVCTYELLFGGGGLRSAATKTVLVVAPAVLTFMGGLQLYDSTFTSAAMPWFYQQVNFILSYGSSLKGGGWVDPVLHRYITPLDWLFVYAPVSYLVTNVTVTVIGATTSSMTFVKVGYYGITNQIVVWMVFAWLPLAVYRFAKTKLSGVELSVEDRFGIILSVWFLWSYLPYVALWLYGRVTYPFYILPALPALAGGAAYFITRDWFPRKMAVIYLTAAFVLFFLYFPVKDFLPNYVRVWLGR